MDSATASRISQSSRRRGQGSWSSPRDEAGNRLGNGSGQPRGGVRLPRRARQPRAVHEPHAGRLALLGTPERRRSRARMRLRKPGKPDWLDLEVIEADPPSRSTEQTVSAGGHRRTRGTYILEELPAGGTRISFEFAWLRIPLLERLAAPVTRAVVRRGNERSLERLAEQLRRRHS